MNYLLGIACLLTPLATSAPTAGTSGPPGQQAVEALIPADAIAYFRYDGYEPHKKAYDQTALAKAMKGDLGEFLEYLAFFAAEALTPWIQEKMPGDMQLIASGWRKVVGYLWRHGLAAAVEVAPQPGGNRVPYLDVDVRLRITLVFPEGGVEKNRDVLLPLLNVLVGAHKLQTGSRTVHVRAAGDTSAAWWQEGRHLVLVLGNDTLGWTLAVADGHRPNLLSNPLWQSVAAFRDYETDVRGFLNIEKIVTLARGPGDTGSALDKLKTVAVKSLLLNQFGLTSLKNIAFHLGFDRQYQRSTTVVSVTEPARRTGLARLVSSSASLSLDTLPPLPPDAASVRVGQLDWKTLVDLTRQAAWWLKLLNLGDPNALDATPDMGLDVHGDLLAHLDSTLVLYNSLSEGPFILGQVAAFKVKDQKKVHEGLQKLLSWVTGNIGGTMSVQTYRGVDMFVYSGLPGVPVRATYTIHKGWLVCALLPQPVKGFILRSEGKHKVWQPPPLVSEALALAQKNAGPNTKLAAVTVSDPRPAVTVGLSLLPVLAAYAGAAGLNFDVTKMPGAQAVTEAQFPGVTLFFDDGTGWRWESHSSFEAPGEWLLFALAYLANGL